MENSNAGGGFETYNLIISGFSENWMYRIHILIFNQKTIDIVTHVCTYMLPQNANFGWSWYFAYQYSSSAFYKYVYYSFSYAQAGRNMNGNNSQEKPNEEYAVRFYYTCIH